MFCTIIKDSIYIYTMKSNSKNKVSWLTLSSFDKNDLIDIKVVRALLNNNALQINVRVLVKYILMKCTECLPVKRKQTTLHL